MTHRLRLVFALPLISIAAAITAIWAGVGSGHDSASATTTTVPATTTVPQTTTTSTTTTTTTTTTIPTHQDPAATDAARAIFGKCGEFYEMAIAVGWPQEEWPTLSQIMWRESRCNPIAWSGSDAGLLQINRVHTDWAQMMGWKWPDDLFVPENNLLFACRLWSASGWGPWRFSGEVPSSSSNKENIQC